MRVVVVGATGLLGRHLVAALVARGDDVEATSRRPGTVAGVSVRVWDPSLGVLPDELRRDLDAVVNLAGTPIGPGRWTAERRARILESRVGPTRAVAAAIGDGPTCLLNASAVGIYGPTESSVDETSPRGRDFLASVCAQWEDATTDAASHGRVVLLRSGIVLARDGGSLPLLARLAKVGLSGTIGSGRQWVSWIHVDDAVGAFLHCLDHDGVHGPVNVVAPGAVRQHEFARALARGVRRPFGVPVPSFAVRAALGEAATLVLDGQQAVPAVLEATGFKPTYATLDTALGALFPSAGAYR